MSVAELKKLVGNKKLIAGSQRTLKELKKGTIKEIFVAANASSAVKAEIEINAKLEKAAVSLLDVTSEELGILIKKPFSVSVVSLLK